MVQQIDEQIETLKLSSATKISIIFHIPYSIYSTGISSKFQQQIDIYKKKKSMYIQLAQTLHIIFTTFQLLFFHFFSGNAQLPNFQSLEKAKINIFPNKTSFLNVKNLFSLKQRLKNNCILGSVNRYYFVSKYLLPFLSISVSCKKQKSQMWMGIAGDSHQLPRANS